MEYRSISDTKTFDYSQLHKYGQAQCGVGIKAPTFKAYAFGTPVNQFVEQPQQTLCVAVPKIPPKIYHYDREYKAYPYATMDEFGKMMRTKKDAY